MNCTIPADFIHLNRIRSQVVRTLTSLDIPTCAVERGGVGAALAFAEHEVGIRRATDPGGARDHVHGVVPQAVDQQNGDPVLVRQLLEDTQVTVVAGIGSSLALGGL